MTNTLWVLALAGILSVPASAQTGADAAWEKLKSLAGVWIGAGEGKTPMEVSYKLISSGSAVMESMKLPAPKPDMVTMYHRDGGALMATHYCDIGNQPRMRAAEVPADGKSIPFRFLDVTNLAKPDGVHMRELTLTFVDADHFTQAWTSRQNGKDSSVVFRWTRKPGSR